MNNPRNTNRVIIEQKSPSSDNEKNKKETDVLKPHNIEANPIPINIIVIVPERDHLSLNHPKGIAPKPISKAPSDHKRIN